jgi:hypothetical protein
MVKERRLSWPILLRSTNIALIIFAQRDWLVALARDGSLGAQDSTNDRA